MFGFARANTELLEPYESTLLGLCYCGLCGNLRENFGILSSLGLGHDPLFFSILTVSQREKEPENGKPVKCPYRGWLAERKTIADKAALDYASALTVLIADEKLQDVQRDRLHNIVNLSRISQYVVRKAYDSLSNLQFPLQGLDLLREKQRFTESAIGLSLDEYLEPSAELLGLACEHTAYLANCPQNHSALYSIGHAIGSLIALADACEDLASDLHTRSYNPLERFYGLKANQDMPLYMFSDILWQIAARTYILSCSLNDLNLEWCPGLVDNVLSKGFPKRLHLSLAHMWHRNHWNGVTAPDSALTFRKILQRSRFSSTSHSLKHEKNSYKHEVWLLGQSYPFLSQIASDLGYRNTESYLIEYAISLFL